MACCTADEPDTGLLIREHARVQSAGQRLPGAHIARAGQYVYYRQDRYPVTRPVSTVIMPLPV